MITRSRTLCATLLTVGDRDDDERLIQAIIRYISHNEMYQPLFSADGVLVSTQDASPRMLDILKHTLLLVNFPGFLQGGSRFGRWMRLYRIVRCKLAQELKEASIVSR